MSIRTIFEFNHDRTDMIERNPDSFVRDLTIYLSSGSKDNAERLSRYGIRLAWTGHHSDERRVVTKYDNLKL